MSVSCSIGASRGAFLSPSAPCTAMRIARTSSRDFFASYKACESEPLKQILFVLELLPQLLNGLGRFLELFLKEPLIRGGFVVLRFFLSQLILGCRGFRLGLALRRLQEGRESPSRASRSCLQQPTRPREGHLRGRCSRSFHHRESTCVRHLGISLESARAKAGCIVGRRNVSGGRRPNLGNLRIDTLSTLSTSSHSSTCCSTSVGKMFD